METKTMFAAWSTALSLVSGGMLCYQWLAVLILELWGGGFVNGCAEKGGGG